MVSVLVSVLVSIRTVASSLLSNCFELKTLAVDPLWGGLLPKAGALPFPKEDGPDGPGGTGGGLPLPVDAPKAGVSLPKAGALFCPNGCCPNSGFPNETMLHSMSSWSSSSRVLGVSSRSISPPSNKNLKEGGKKREKINCEIFQHHQQHYQQNPTTLHTGDSIPSCQFLMHRL